MNYDILLPDLGEGIESAEVSDVLISVGEAVEKDATILVLESDKASMEIPSDVSGVVTEVVVKKGDELTMGQLLAKVELTKESPIETTEIQKEQDAKEQNKPVKQQHQILLPDLGEGIESAEVSEVLISVGEAVEKDATILVLESDKASMEIPSDVSGVVTEVVVKKGDELTIGQLLAKVELTEESPIETTEIQKEQDAKEQNKPVKQTLDYNKQIETKTLSKTGSVFASPGVRRLARELDIDLNSLTPTGQKGRITKEDLHLFIKNKINASTQEKTNNLKKKIDFSVWGPIEEKPLTKIQKITGDRLQAAWNEIPHVTQFGTADITDLDNHRKNLKEKYKDKGVKITFLPFLIKAVSKILEKYPTFNSSLDYYGENIIIKNYHHIGIAVDTDQGLVVPVIKDANKKNLIELSEELEMTSKKARGKKLTANEIKGGTFTISSLGGIGGSFFTPIVNHPEVAILGVSKSKWEQVYDEDLEEFRPRFVMPFSVSYDHRVIDGADGARFVKDFSLILENTNSFKDWGEN